jgi:uncharacterized membrane protein YkoI
MKTSTNLILATALLGTLGLGTMVRLVNAAQTQAPIAIMPESRNGHQSAQAGNKDGETKDDAKEQVNEPKESSKLQSLARITAQQAQQAAEAAQGGQASGVKLENENGNLVYAVTIGKQEVKVDAGNGKVLYTETANQENKASEANRPRSSIQVSEAPGGDGDGETNDDG